MNEPVSQVVGKLPYGVYVVTVGRGGAENGLTVSWLSQASFDPPMVVLAVDKLHYSEEILRSTKTFVVNVLGDDQKKLAAQFARETIAGENKLSEVPTHPADGGAAILDGALAFLDCQVEAIHPAGDHLLVLGRVETAGILREGRPLTTLESGLRYHKSRPGRRS